MAEFPAPRQGFVLTHFIVTSDLGRSRRFYAGVLGGEVLLEGRSRGGPLQQVPPRHASPASGRAPVR